MSEEDVKDSQATKLTVVNKLLDRLNNSKENKVIYYVQLSMVKRHLCKVVWQVQERSAHALGYLLVGEPKFVHRKKLIDGLCEASKVLFFVCLHGRRIF